MLVAALVLVAGCGGGGGAGGTSSGPPAAPATMTLRSPAFASGATIPDRYTCASLGISPPLAWSGVPERARELALLVDDPDAPGGTFVHWVLFHLQPGLRHLEPGTVPDGARQGESSAGAPKWAAPCPPKGDAPHRYEFSVYALRAELRQPDGASADAVRAAIGRSAIARGRLVGRFGR